MTRPLGRLHQQVLDAYRRAEAGLTDEELAERVKLLRWSAGARRNELVEMGLLVDSGTTRPSNSGRPSKVWILAAAGGPITTHRAGVAVRLRSGVQVQVCSDCGVQFPEVFPEGTVVFERDDAVSASRPAGTVFTPCRRARKAATL